MSRTAFHAPFHKLIGEHGLGFVGLRYVNWRCAHGLRSAGQWHCYMGIVGAGCASLAIGMVICHREQGLCPPGDWYRSGIGSTDGAFMAI